MTSRVLCQLDPGATGAGLIVDDGGLIVTTNQHALNFARAVHGTLPVRKEGVYSYECYHYSQSRGDLSGLVSIGVSQPGGSLAVAVGNESLSWGLRPADGAVYTNSASLATVQETAERTCIGVRLSLSALSCTVGWYVNGALLHEATLPNGKAWVPAFSLGGAEAGDIAIAGNFGQWRFDSPLGDDRWAIQTQGLSTIYVAHAAEAFLSDTIDSPANQTFGPYLIAPEKFSVRRSGRAWPHREGSGSVATSAFGTLRFDNSKGTFNALRDADVRDSPFVIARLDAPAGGAGSLSDAGTVSSAIIESVRAADRDTLEVTLMDNLKRLDAPLPCKIIPPYYDEAVRGRIQPVGLGAQRNVQPLLLDQATNLYLLGDAPFSNVTLVTDGGAPLDPEALIPQWTAALNGQGIALNVAPAKRLTADCSTVGDQYFIPGAEDVLEGLGTFTSWKDGVPVGWEEISSPGNGSILQVSQFGITSGLAITSRIHYNPQLSATRFGYWVKLATPVLLPGRTYRISFKLPHVQGTSDGGSVSNYGLALLTDVSAALGHRSQYWITPHENPLYQALPATQNYTFSYRVPGTQGDPALPIYICVFSDTGLIPSVPTTLTGIAYIDDLRVQLVGQYLSIPLDGIGLTEAFTEILVNRCGESPAIFSGADTDAIDAATGYKIGIRYEDQPNTAALLQEIADAFGAMVFCDKNNVIRVRRLVDPKDGDIVAEFTESNIDTENPRRFRVWADDAPGLTTNFGYRRNQVPLAPGDFVTDTDLVSPSQREQWQGRSQFRFRSASQPAQEYAHAVGAPRFDMLHDVREHAQTEGNRVVRIFTPADPGGLSHGISQTAPNSGRGKRNWVQFDAFFEGTTLGLGPSVVPEDLLPGDIVRLFYRKKISARQWLTVIDRRILVMDVEPYSFDGRVTITGMY